MASEAPREKERKRKYAFACSVCRARRVRCDGLQPVCSNCARSGRSCNWDRVPPTTVVTALSQQLQSANALILAIRTSHDLSDIHGATQTYCESLLPAITLPSGFHDSGSLPHLANYLLDSLEPVHLADPSTILEDYVDFQRKEAGRSQYVSKTSVKTKGGKSRSAGGVDELTESVAHLTIEPHGELFWSGGTTSVFEVPDPAQYSVAGEAFVPMVSPPTLANLSTEDRKLQNDTFAINKQQVPMWEFLASTKLNTAQYTNPPHLASHLINVYFEGPHFDQNVLYKPLFYKAVATDNSHSCTLLIYAILAEAARHHDSSDSGLEVSPEFYPGELYARKAKNLVSEVLDRVPTLPMIQALLILAYRECELGNQHSGWALSGMAIRAVYDLGCHIDIGLAQSLSAEVIEIRELRRRVFWAVYRFDRMLALTMGRVAMLMRSSIVTPGLLADRLEDVDIWKPPRNAQNYPTVCTHNVEVFQFSCELYRIIGDSLLWLYSGLKSVARHRSFQAVGLLDRIDRLYSDLPAHLVLETRQLPEYAPPYHIFDLNILFRTARLIILRRQLRQTCTAGAGTSKSLPESHIELSLSSCIRQVEEIDCLFSHRNTTFGLANLSYWSTYAAYVAALINIFVVNTQEKLLADQATSRLQFNFQVLERAAARSPAWLRSIEFLKTRAPPEGPITGSQHELQVYYNDAMTPQSSSWTVNLRPHDDLDSHRQPFLISHLPWSLYDSNQDVVDRTSL